MTTKSQPRNNIMAIASGKGGVGKTWLSVTLASLIARSGRRCLLFDGDLGLANVDIQLGLTTPRDLGSVISGRATLKDVIATYDTGGFDIIAGRSGSGSLADLSPERLEALLDELHELARNYEVILLDLGAGVEQHVRMLSAAAARCLVVVTDEPTSMTDAYAFIKLCLLHPPSPEMHIVVNQATTLKEGQKTYEALSKACETFLQVTPPLAGVIRRDSKVKEAIRSQTSLIVRSPHCTAATDAAALAVKLLAKP